MTAAAAAAAGYTLAAGPVRADVIKTDTSGLKAGDAKVKVTGGEMPVYFAKPEGKSDAPVILVAMEIFGLHEYIKDVTRRLAKLGAFAVAPDYYFRSGVDLTKMTDVKRDLRRSSMPSRMPSCSPISMQPSPGPVARRRYGPLGIVGFCRGGRTAGNMPPIAITQGGRGVLRLAGRSGEPGLAEKPDRSSRLR